MDLASQVIADIQSATIRRGLLPVWAINAPVEAVLKTVGPKKVGSIVVGGLKLLVVEAGEELETSVRHLANLSRSHYLRVGSRHVLIHW